jgi:hypothetical protein
MGGLGDPTARYPQGGDMTKITVDREALDRWKEALKSLDPHIQQLAVNALRVTAVQDKLKEKNNAS